MAEMGRYCKAYLVSDFAKYSNWNPNLENLRQPESDDPNKKVEPRTELDNDDILYLQEDFIVTDGIFRDENIIYDDVNDDWKAFCEKDLDFAIPSDVAAIGAEQDEAAAQGESA